MIYLDNSATTPMYPELLQLIERYSVEQFYNPSGLYSKALDITKDINTARKTILDILGATNYELIFTSGGTESNNTLIKGARLPKNSRIIISAMEHAAVHNAINELTQKGFEVVYAPCDNYGKVITEEFAKLMTPNTALVSIMHVCNETGAINDIAALVKIAKDINMNVIFHSDGVQAIGKTKVKLSALGVDAYSFSAHKFHGMKGVGGLFIKKGLNIAPLLVGGGQEKGLRSTTENVSGIITTAAAIQKVHNDMDNYCDCRDVIIKELQELEPDIRLNTNTKESVKTVLSVAFPDCRGEVLLHSLEDLGVIAGTGSACSSHKGNNRIAKALGLDKEYSMGMLRISMNNYTTEHDIQTFLSAIKQAYQQYRKVSRR